MKTSKLCVTGLCAGKSPVTGEFPTQRANNAENVSIWWRNHDAIVKKRKSNACKMAANLLYKRDPRIFKQRQLIHNTGI